MASPESGELGGGVRGQSSDDRDEAYVDTDETDEDGEDARNDRGERGENRGEDRSGVEGADPRRAYMYGEEGEDKRRAVPAVMGWAEAGLVSIPGPWLGLRGEEDWRSGRGRERKCGRVGGEESILGESRGRVRRERESSVSLVLGV